MDSERFSRLGLVVLLTSALACGMYATFNASQRIQVPHQIDYEEGNVLNAAVRITHGLTPYPDPQGWPVVLNPYGPIPYYLAAIPVQFYGPHFTGPRAIVLLATLLCAVFIGLIVVEATRSRLAGWAFGALFVSQTLVQFWMAVLRVDLIGLALTLAALYVFLRFPRQTLLAALLFALAVLTKFSFLAAPAACFVYLVMRRAWLRAAVFFIGGCVILAALFGVMQLGTQGAFAFDVLGSHPDPMVWSHYAAFFRFLLLSNPLLLVFAFIGLALSLKRNVSLPAIYALLATGATATAGKLGSNDNHMLEMVAVFCIMGGIAAVKMAQMEDRAQWAAGGFCLLIGLWMVAQMPFDPTPRPLSGCIAAYQFVGNSPGQHILSEDVGALVTNERPVWVSNPFVYAQLAMAGKSSDEPLRRRIQQHYFDLILLSADPQARQERWSPEVRTTVEKNYDMVGEFQCKDAAMVYVPHGTVRNR